MKPIPRCSCGSLAVIDDPDKMQCDVCWRDLQISNLKAQLKEHEWVAVEDRLPGTALSYSLIECHAIDDPENRQVFLSSYSPDFEVFIFLNWRAWVPLKWRKVNLQESGK